MPQGTPVPEDQIIDRPRFTLEPMHDYTVPPIVRIGVVEFVDNGKIPGYSGVCDELLQNELSGIEGVEPVFIAYDRNILGGALMYDRAAWICEYYGVDALILSELSQFEIYGGGSSVYYSRTIRVKTTVKSKLLEGTGGSEYWNAEIELNESHDANEYERNNDLVLRNNLRKAIRDLVSNLASSAALEGGYVE